jgi:SNF2 family DNA or RNA helicase
MQDWYPIPYVPKTTAMKHQVNALTAAYQAPARPSRGDNFAYLMDMGTGKTKVVLDEWGAGVLNGAPNNLLVIAPAGSYRNWFADKNEIQRAEINVHLPDEIRANMLVNHWSSGSGKAHRESLTEFLKPTKRPRALFVNVEALSTVEAAQELCEQFLESGDTYMAVDESTTIKGVKSLRGRYVMNIGQRAAVRRIMTGLLTPRSPLDAWGQFNFLDWRIIGNQSYYAFKRKYAITKKIQVDAEYIDGEPIEGTGRLVDMVVGYQNIEELHERIAPYSFRVLKEECLDLTPKVFLTRDVKHTKEQARIYKELREKATAEILRDKFVSVDMVIQLMIRLHQVNLGYAMDDDGTIHDIEENRTDEIIQIIDEHRGKTVVWTPFIHRIQTLREKLGKEYGPKAIAMYYGGNRNTRHEDEARFIGDPDCKIMLATQGAGMRGNTWVCADLNIYDSNTHDLEQRQQSEDRTHRKGQTRSVTYVDLMTEGTVDYKFVHALRNKYDMSTRITGENMRAWI